LSPEDFEQLVDKLEDVRAWLVGRALDGHVVYTDVLEAIRMARALQPSTPFPNGRPIRVGGRTYDSARQAAFMEGVSPSTMSRWVSKGRAAYLDGGGVRRHKKTSRKSARAAARALRSEAEQEGWL